MSTTNTGGPAFPSHGSMGEVAHEGMTLRDYFAAKVMQGLLANNNIDAQQIAEAAFIVADAMLKAREA
jgi:hypothetical protein